MANKTVFVYGTLKEGGALSHHVSKNRINSKNATLKGFDLYDLGWFPGIVPGNGTVLGELHEFDNPDVITEMIDKIEGYSPDHPETSLYLRKEVTVRAENKDIVTEAYIFNKEITEKKKLIKSGNWLIN